MLLLSSVRAGQAMMFANHSLESCFSQRIREFFGSFPAVFQQFSGTSVWILQCFLMLA